MNDVDSTSDKFPSPRKSLNPDVKNSFPGPDLWQFDSNIRVTSSASTSLILGLTECHFASDEPFVIQLTTASRKSAISDTMNTNFQTRWDDILMIYNK